VSTAKRWTALLQGVLHIAGRNRLSGNTNDVVEIEIEMLKVEEVVDDEESSSNNGPDDNDDDDGTYGSPVRRSPRNRTMSTKARETVVSSEVKEKVSDKYLRFDAARHKAWHVSVRFLCLTSRLLFIASVVRFLHSRELALLWTRHYGRWPGDWFAPLRIV